MHSPRNPADLLGLGTDPALIRLLRACGTDEAYVTGNAPDYDKLSALAAALPLCEGHPLVGEVNAKLTKATGVSLPLCPHTVKTHWEGWVDGYLYGEMAACTPTTVCPLCSFVAPKEYWENELTHLPDPLGVSAHDLALWGKALEAFLADGTPALFCLPHDYAFVRPDLYHAGLAVGKVSRGEALTKAEGDLLVTQALRIWGMALDRREVGDEPALLVQGGDPSAVISLLAYLDASHALPPMVWIPREPAHAGEVSGLYSRVGTGYAMEATDTAEDVEEKKRTYATVAPIDRAIVLME